MRSFAKGRGNQSDEFVVCRRFKVVGADHKPNSVPPSGYPNRRRRSFIWDTGCPATQATYPGARTGSPQTLLYLVLHRVGFTQLLRSPEELVRSYRTVSPLPCQNDRAVYFLLHFPSRHRDSTLWSTLPCGVRTFLRTNVLIQRSFVLLRPFFMIFPVNNPLTAGTIFQAVAMLEINVRLGRNIQITPLTDRIFNFRNSHAI